MALCEHALIVTPAAQRPQDLVDACVRGGTRAENIEHTSELTQAHLDRLHDAYVDADGRLRCQLVLVDDPLACTAQTRSSLEKCAVYYTHHMHMVTLITVQTLQGAFIRNFLLNTQFVLQLCTSVAARGLAIQLNTR